MPSTWLLSGVLRRYETSAPTLTPAMFLARLTPNRSMLSA